MSTAYPASIHRSASSPAGYLFLYGCGDCIDGYEGITGHEEYRDALRLLYFASIAPGTGELAALTMVPMQARNMRLLRASAADSRWLAATLGQISREFGSRVEHRPGGRLMVHPPPASPPRPPGPRPATRGRGVLIRGAASFPGRRCSRAVMLAAVPAARVGAASGTAERPAEIGTTALAHRGPGRRT